MSGYFGNDDELRDRNGHFPNTLGRNIATALFVAVFIAAIIAFIWIVCFV